jgi:hypothetical protein
LCGSLLPCEYTHVTPIDLILIGVPADDDAPPQRHRGLPVPRKPSVEDAVAVATAVNRDKWRRVGIAAAERSTTKAKILDQALDLWFEQQQREERPR